MPNRRIGWTGCLNSLPVQSADTNLTADGATTYVYDADNRLLSTFDGIVLTYDPIGRLHQVYSSPSVITRFLYDGADLIAEYDGSGALQKRYVHGPGLDEPLVEYAGSGTTNRSYLLADERGSVIGVVNTAGTVTVNKYNEYGVPAATNQGRFQYTGQMWLSEVGLYHYKARAYHPRLGRFLQTDPIGTAGGMNLYGYVGNDPVNRKDPSGLDFICWTEPCEITGTRPKDPCPIFANCYDWDPSYFTIPIPYIDMPEFPLGAGTLIDGGGSAPAEATKETSGLCSAPSLTASGLEPRVQDKADFLLFALNHAGYTTNLGRTFRTYAEQDLLYAQGRTMPSVIVTNAKGGESFHNFGLAFDIVMLDAHGQYISDGSNAAYTEAGNFGELIGLEWGGKWKSPFDPSHFQFTNGLTLDQVRANHNAGCGQPRR